MVSFLEMTYHGLYVVVFILQEGCTCVHIAAMKGSVSVMKELSKFNPAGIITSRNKVRFCYLQENMR